MAQARLKSAILLPQPPIPLEFILFQYEFIETLTQSLIKCLFGLVLYLLHISGWHFETTLGKFVVSTLYFGGIRPGVTSLSNV